MAKNAASRIYLKNIRNYLAPTTQAIIENGNTFRCFGCTRGIDDKSNFPFLVFQQEWVVIHWVDVQ